MNDFLARGLGIINVLVALFIVILMTVGMVDIAMRYSPDGQDIGVLATAAVVGFLLGCVAACLGCGVIAIQIGVYRELRSIRALLAAAPAKAFNIGPDGMSRGGEGAMTATRRDPSINL